MELGKGNRDVEEYLAPQIYGELHQIAVRLMRRERNNHTLQATALVNEAYTHLIQEVQIPWQSRVHFYAIAAKLMRRILVDHARARNARKRGGIQHQTTLGEGILAVQGRPLDVLALHEALEHLAEFANVYPKSLCLPAVQYCNCSMNLLH